MTTVLIRNPEATVLKEMMQLWYEEVISEGKLFLIKDLIAPQAIHHDPNMPGCGWPRGTDIAAAFWGIYKTAAPDLVFRVVGQYVDGDLVVTRWLASGTHTGLLGSLSATGKTFVLSGTSVCRFEHGKVVETWSLSDLSALQKQLTD